MAEQSVPRIFGTQARILITEWRALAKLIVAHSVVAKERPIASIEELESFDIEHLENITFSTADELPNLLTTKQIQTALQGPFGDLLKEKMTAYAKIARLRLAVHLSKEDLFKGRRATLPPEEQVSDKLLEKLSFNQLERLQIDLDNLTTTHNEEWQQFLQEWTSALINFFAYAKLALTEREINDLEAEDIAPELVARFIELGMTLPKKKYPSLRFTDYLYLKALLTAQSALSRQHLEHDSAQIEQRLKDFKHELMQMEKQEQDLAAAQKNLTLGLLSVINA